MAVQLSPRAQRELRALKRTDKAALAVIEQAIGDLDGRVANLDIKPLTGRRPWMRLRTGDWRILFRPITPDEHPVGGYLVARIVNRRDLDEAVRKL